MQSLKTKLIDWKDRLKDRHMLSVVVVFIAIITALGIFIYKKQIEYRQTSENQYNMAFYELVDYVRNVETYLAKSMISSTPQSGAENLTYVWREANLAQSYLARLPLETTTLSNTAKFLNQVSNYSYSLSRKNINGEELKEEDFTNIKQLHDYSTELANTLDQLSEDINSGRVKWGELTKKGRVAFAQQVDNISKDSFLSIEENFHEYQGLIYDGAFSEHITGVEKKGLTGNDIDENKAEEIAKSFIGEDKVLEIHPNGLSENTDMPAFDFSIKLKDAKKDNNLIISITKKGGHVVFMSYNREIEAESIDYEGANRIGLNFLTDKGFPDMKETYYLNQSGILTINYAYIQNGVVIYPDLIKLKIALDNGEIMGIETTGFLNAHYERMIPAPKITIEKAKETLNRNIEILSEELAIIPTEFRTEIFCYEFKGKIDDREFLVYINAETGKEEDILMIVNTPNGILTM